MAKMVWNLARWLLGFGLLLIGAKTVPEPSSTLEQRWRDMIPWTWLEANWIALACFVLAAVLFSYQPFKWWIDRQNLRDARLRIRSNLAPGSFNETDGAEALRYLLRESIWSWQQYARRNFLDSADGMHLHEFERAARSGDIITTGYGSRENMVVVIERRYWVGGRIEPATAKLDHAVVMSISPDGSSYRRFYWSQLAVSTADLHATWPRASFLRRGWSHTWVHLKTQFWYGSPLSNRLEARRRRSQPDRTFS